MFTTLATEVNDRFSSLEAFFKDTRSSKGQHAAMLKGLMFVQVYAVYEFTVRGVVRAAINSIVTHRRKLKEIRPSLMALLLDPEWNSVRDSGKKRQWEQRLKVLERAFSNEFVTIPSDTSIPSDGSHYRYSQLCVIFRVFGIVRMPVRRRLHIQRIAEVVGHRNAIAHGQETAEEIGRRYTRTEVLRISRQMHSVCRSLVDALERLCSNSSSYSRS